MLYKITYLPLSPWVWIWRKLKVDKIKISTCANILIFSPEGEYIEVLRPQIDQFMSDCGNPRWHSGKKKKSACQCGRCKRCRFNSWIGKIPWSRRWPPTPIFLPANMVFTTMWNNFYLGLFLRFWPHSSIMYRNLFKGLSLTWGRSVVAIRILKPPLQQD